MKDALLSLLGSLGLAYWVKVSTESPSCIYYFGPFASEGEASAAQPGYLEDLQAEGAKNLLVTLERRRQPHNLTITDDWGDADPWQTNRLSAIAS